MLKRPESSEYAGFYEPYISKIPDTALIPFFQSQKTALLESISPLEEGKLDYRYAEGKWSLREALTHIIDTERIFSYRLLAIVRGETGALPGFDQDVYMDASNVSKRKKANLLNEFASLRDSNIYLFESIEEQDWMRSTVVSGGETTARSIAYMIAGHCQHHLQIINERYL